MTGEGRSIERLVAVNGGICPRLHGFDQRHSLGSGGEPRQPSSDDGFSDARIRAGHQYDATHTRSGEQAQDVVDVLFLMRCHHAKPDARGSFRYRWRAYRSSEHTGLAKP